MLPDDGAAAMDLGMKSAASSAPRGRATCWRAFSVLLFKNLLLKWRNPVASSFEFILPVLFFVAMTGIYSLFPNNAFGNTENSAVRYSPPPFSVVPFRVALMRNVIAVAPRDAGDAAQAAAVNKFVSDMSALHPAINFSSIGDGVLNSIDAKLAALYVPGFADVYKVFESEKAIQDYVQSSSYDTDWESESKKKVWAAIVFNSGAPAYDYKIRMNATMVPNTGGNQVNVLTRGYDDASINAYTFAKMTLTGPPFLVEAGTEITRLPYPGFLSLQLMVDRWILNAPVAPSRLDLNYMLKVANAVVMMCLAPSQVYAQFGGALNKAVATLQQNSSPKLKKLADDLAPWLADMRYAPQSVDFTPFPFFAYNQNGFYGIALQILSFFLVIAYVFPVSRLIRGMVLEKEMKMREGMKMMGLGDLALFGSWMAFYGIFWALLSLIIALISNTKLGSGGNIFAASGFGYVFIMFFLFGLSCSTFAYLISIFFSQSKTASSIGIVVFIASFFPVFTVSDGAVATSDKVWASLLAPTAFGLTLNAAGLLEQNGAGVTDVTTSAVINNFSYNYGCGMLILDTILYAVLAWYIDAVLPARFREFGVPRPYNFPFTAAYWREVFGLPADAASVTHNNAGPSAASRDSGPDPSFIEPPDATLLAKEREGRFVGLSKLRKEFDTPDGVKVAVDGIDMHMYEGQIFVLLGHNGAGKTTTISMLTGLIAPTSGGMSIFGRDVSTQLSEVRHDLGVCPQHNVLWPELTVREHLQVFSEIKGVPSERRNAEILKAVADVGLTEKIDVLSSNLSGGQKRKLSVCIALVGGVSTACSRRARRPSAALAQRISSACAIRRPTARLARSPPARSSCTTKPHAALRSRASSSWTSQPRAWTRTAGARRGRSCRTRARAASWCSRRTSWMRRTSSATASASWRTVASSAWARAASSRSASASATSSRSSRRPACRWTPCSRCCARTCPRRASRPTSAPS